MEFLIFVIILIVLDIWDRFIPNTKNTPSDYVKRKPRPKSKLKSNDWYSDFGDILVEPTEPIKPLDSPGKFHYGNQFMSAEDKQLYLKSVKWAKLRNAVFTRDAHTCQMCGSQHSLQCHHISYECLGNEPLEHLTTLCNTCHTLLHNKLGYDRKSIFPIK